MEAISIVLARIDLKEGMVGGIDAVWSVFIGVVWIAGGDPTHGLGSSIKKVGGRHDTSPTLPALSTMKFFLFAIAATHCATLATAGYDEVQQDMPWVYTTDWGESANYETTASGLRYKMLAPRRRSKGTSIAKGDSVKVMYKLYIEGAPEHKHIYSQSTMAESFGLVAGRGGVIKGFDEAVLLMKDGDRGRFMMPHDIAYGTSGQAGFGIPGSAELEYFLEVHTEGGSEL